MHVLNGNHEVMNAAQQFRYTTLGGLLGFGRWRQLHAVEGALKVCRPKKCVAMQWAPFRCAAMQWAHFLLAGCQASEALSSKVVLFA